MQDRIIFSIFILPIIIYGVLCIIIPKVMFKTTATNTLKKTPTKSNVKTYRVGGFFITAIGVLFIVLIITGSLGPN